MTTLEDIRRELDKDELDYDKLARTYGEEALPNLRALVAEDDPRISSKAAYLAGLINGTLTKEIVSMAARSRHSSIRVAAAAVAAKLPSAYAAEITSQLLTDSDAGVRVRALKSADTLNDPTLVKLIQTIAAEDTAVHIRDFAETVSKRISHP